MQELRILVADDHSAVRQSVGAMIAAQHGWTVCGEAVDGRDALEKTQTLRPDVIVMDITMSPMNGLEATREILKIAPQTRILIFTIHESAEILRLVQESGARGCVSKCAANRDLLPGIEALAQGLTFFPTESAQRPRYAA